MGIRYPGPRTRSKGRSTQNAQSTRHSKVKVGRRGIGHGKNEFEVLALLRMRVKEMRANGEMDAQHDVVAATQPQEQIEEESRDFKTLFV